MGESVKEAKMAEGMKTRKDFVKIRLSAAGAKLAGAGVLRVHNAHGNHAFKAGQVVEVTRAYEWNKLLSQEKIGSDPIFEIVEDKPAAAGQEG